MAERDGGGSSSSEDGSEPMEVNIPPDLARELGQDPGVIDGNREREVEDEILMEQEHEVAAREDSVTGESLDLKKVAADYAQYLAVNSRQDVRIVYLFYR